MQFLYDSKLSNSYKNEVEDLSPWIIHVSYIFTYYTAYLICSAEPIHMSKVLSYRNPPRKRSFESTCLLLRASAHKGS